MHSKIFMDKTIPVSIFWFRRDLRLHDNAGLYHALRSGLPVLPLFIFDTTILGKLPDRDDARVTFIYRSLLELNSELENHGSSLVIKHGKPLDVWELLTEDFNIKAVFTNNDYEPYATQRDAEVSLLLAKKNISFSSFKDHVIFEKSEIVKEDGQPYSVYSAYQRKWYEKIRSFHLKSYPTEKYYNKFSHIRPVIQPSLEEIGFTENKLTFPDKEYLGVLKNYSKTRDIPSIPGTSEIGVHLRFGTLSIRDLARNGITQEYRTWLNELIWRDFYAMILWHFPHTAQSSFKKNYDEIRWRNNEDEFRAWCQGKTGYPLVDAGMRQLNSTGWMHNRLRMITASFLTKHLLIDWRWGEAYFARLLLDYDMASNVGGWQWAASSGNDAVPYFRIFNPILQTKKFDPALVYIKKWVPEFAGSLNYPRPIVDHAFARQRAIAEFKRALTPK